ncbi:MAG TPA: c-type cytochrome [Rhodocyclaceae bacterium]|nr:c-type cytochrome [Rhodocyclaceae bacterium]
MADQKNPSGPILWGTIIAAVILVSIAVPFANKGDKTQVASSMSTEDADVRIQPVARFELTDASAAAASGKPRAGSEIYQAVCGACHGTGAAGAPKVGDKAAWGPRIAQGKEALYKSALGGKNAMPARGGAADLSDAEVKAAVDHILSLNK